MMWLLFLIPAAAILLMFWPGAKIRQGLAVSITLGLACLMLGYTLVNGVSQRQLSGGFNLDRLSLATLAIVLVVGLTAALYSTGYLRFSVGEHAVSEKEHRRYFVLFMCFYTVLLWTPLVRNIIWLWVFIEAAALASVFLVDFRQTAHTLEASWKYMVMMEIGGATALIGTLIIIGGEPAGRHLLTWPELLQQGSVISSPALKLGFSLMVVGYGLKAGLVPLHTWLPDAHSQAPSPISAMLSGIKINAALYAILRFYDIMAAAGEGSFATSLLRFLGILTVLVAVAMTTVQRDYKRLFAYSSTENMGLILLGYTLGPLGIYGALLQMINHALIKPGLFYLSGNLLIAHGSTEIDQVRGTVYTLPWSGRLLFLLMLAIAGAPPFGLFLSELMILLSAFTAHLLWLGILLVILLAWLFANFLRYALNMVFGRPAAAAENAPRQEIREKGNWQTVLPPLIHLVASLFMGLAIPGLWQHFLI